MSVCLASLGHAGHPLVAERIARCNRGDGRAVASSQFGNRFIRARQLGARQRPFLELPS